MAKGKEEKETTETSEAKGLQRHESGTDLAYRLAATPFSFMRRFGEEMDRLFDDFGIGHGRLAPVLERLGDGRWAPQVEVFERDNKLIIRADLPGLKKDDVNVEVSEDSITIQGERNSEHEERRGGVYRSERSYGAFYRRIPIPEGIDVKDASAAFNNGVLEITMAAPKLAGRQPRRLEIKGDAGEHARGKAA